ncbi:hypothetical protein WAI453_003918 [Rhynchosporium graminicola]
MPTRLGFKSHVHLLLLDATRVTKNKITSTRICGNSSAFLTCMLGNEIIQHSLPRRASETEFLIDTISHKVIMQATYDKQVECLSEISGFCSAFVGDSLEYDSN